MKKLVIRISYNYGMRNEIGVSIGFIQRK